MNDRDLPNRMEIDEMNTERIEGYCDECEEPIRWGETFFALPNGCICPDCLASIPGARLLEKYFYITADTATRPLDEY